MWTGKNDLKTLRVDADFFENGRKKGSVNVFKNIRIRVDGAIDTVFRAVASLKIEMGGGGGWWGGGGGWSFALPASDLVLEL